MAKRKDIYRPRNGGQWTEARFKAFVIAALRNASGRWGPKHASIKKAFVRHGINPATGRKCKLHACAHCPGLFPQSEMKADHIAPVVDPEEGFRGWDVYVERLFQEVDGFQALCGPCHDIKSRGERSVRGGLPVVGAPRSRKRSNRKG